MVYLLKKTHKLLLDISDLAKGQYFLSLKEPLKNKLTQTNIIKRLF